MRRAAVFLLVLSGLALVPFASDGASRTAAAEVDPVEVTTDPPPRTEATTDPPPTTEPPPVGLTVAAVGDIACPPSAPVTPTTCQDQATAALIAAHSPAAVFVLGDSQYNSATSIEYAGRYALSYGAFWPISYPSPGNHEYRTPGATGYYDYCGPRAQGSPGYYAFDLPDLAGWRFYALNSNCAKIDCWAQRRWMAADIKAHPALCQAMFMHHPRYSSGGGYTVGKRFWTLAVAEQFELALAGHAHNYERFDRMDAFGAVTDTGVQSFISGSGGKSLYGFDVPQPGSQVRYGDDFGVLFLTFDPSGYGWDFRTVSDVSVDSGSTTCR